MVCRKTVFLALFSMIFTTNLVVFALPIAGTASADGIWAEHELADAPITGAATNTQPSAYQLYRLDSFVLGFFLNSAPLEGNGSLALSLPMPDGSYRTFNIWQRPVLDAATQAAHPTILALAGEAADDSRVRIVLDYAPTGFNAMIDLTGEKMWMIDQHPNGTDDYVIAYRAGTTPRAITCLCPDHIEADVPHNAGANVVPENCVGGVLRKMDLGIAVSERVTAALGGQAAALNHVNTLVNRINLVFERDLAVRFILVSGTATIYDAGNPEPNVYPHEASVQTGPSGIDLNVSDANLDAALGANGYDVGFSLTQFDLGGGGGFAGSGLAQTPSLCLAGRGDQVTAYSNHAINDSYLGLVIHEVGHQFSAGHTTAGNTGNCAPANGGFNPNSAVETGSGSTIMSYAGICASDNLQNDSDLYFHGFSLQQMNNWIASRSCYDVCPPDGNTIPTVTADDCVVPLETPFTLEATGNDADGNPLTYTWEQVDLSVSHSVSQPDNGMITLFRSYPPTASPTRDFPSLSGVLSGVLPLGEKYPLVSRTLNFMVTVRDGVNGACSHAVQVVVADVGPLTISLPSAGQVLQCTQSITWDPVLTETLTGGANVNILLSTDGGNTFPTTLAANVPNDGSQVVTMPNLSTTTARIRIEPASGCWWVLSKEFTIEPCPSGKLFATGNNMIDDTCGNGNSNENGVIDPGESGFLASIELSATTAPVNGIVGTLVSTTPGVIVTSGTQLWPNLNPGTPASNNSPFTFAVPASHPCGAPVTFDLTLNTSSGSCTLPVSFATGRPVTNVFSYTGPIVNVPAGNGGSNITLPVSGLGGNVIDVDLLIDGATCDGFSPSSSNGINYPGPGIVELTLTSPGNTSVVVQNGVPGGNVSSANSNICGTEYDDEAPGIAIPATINGNFINQNFFPSTPLSAFDGQTGNGNWILNVTMSPNFGNDPTFGDRTVTAWGLRITTLVCDPPKDSADLMVIKGGPATAEIGVAFPYSLTVMNNGPDTATNVTLTDTLPAGVTPASVGPFALGTLAAGASTTVTFMVTAAGPLRTIENCASVSSADVIDPVMVNNTNCASTILIGALGDVSLSASGPATVDCGESFAYTLIVSNLSPFIASNVVVTSTVPSSCVIVLDATDPCVVVSAGEVVCTIPNVAINGSVQLDIDVMVAACCAVWTNESILFLANDTDAANNAASVVTTQIADNTPPSFTAAIPNTLALGCNPTPAQFPNPAFILNTAVDNCGVSTSFFQNADSQTGCNFTRIISYTTVDICGNSFSANSEVTWTEDTAAPTFGLAIPATLDLGCNPTAADFPDNAVILASATDNCGIVNRSVTAITNGGPCVFRSTISYLAEDGCGRMATETTIVTWSEDVQPPSFGNCSPAAFNLGCNPVAADFPDPAVVLASAQDTCGVVSSWVESVRTTNDCDITMVQDFYAVDACGFTGTCQRTIQWIENNGAPTFPAAPAATLDLGCNPAAADFPDVAAVLASATDDCGITTSSSTVMTNGGPCAFSAIYTWTAVNTCNMTSETVSVVDWREDLVAPTFSDCSPASTNLGCNPLPADFPDPSLVLASAFDACGVVTSWVDAVRNTNGCDITMVQDFYAVDACGFTGTCQRTIQWTESNAESSFPLAPGPLLDLGCNPAAADFPDVEAILASVNAACGISASSASAVTNGGPCVFDATLTWSAVDRCGVTVETVTVVNWIEDTEVPTFTDCSPATTNLGCNPLPGDFPDPAIVLGSATDNCGVVTSWIESVETTIGCNVTRVENFYAVDACGFTGTCQRTIQWTSSTEPPIFTAAPAAVLDLGCNPAAGDFPDTNAILASATDDCGNIINSQSMVVTSGGPCQFSATYTWTAADSCGVTGTAVTVVNWTEDNAAPTFTNCGPAVTNLGCNPAASDFPDPAIVLASAVDNCGVVTSWVEAVRITNGCDVSMVQTFYAVDTCNQTGTCQRTIEWIESSQPPRFTAAPPAFLDLGCNPAASDFPDSAAVLASASDDCLVASSEASVVTNGTACAMRATYTWTAVDSCGVTGTAVTVVNWIDDSEAPTIACPSSVSLGCNPAAADFPDPALTLATATDDCGVVTSWVDVVRTTNGCDRIMERTFYAVDACSQTGSCVQTIAWTEDSTPPNLSCGPSGDLGCNPAAIPPAEATATDDCGPVGPVLVASQTTNGCQVTLVRIWNAIDACAQSASCTQTFTWTVDLLAPRLDCLDQTIPLVSGAALPGPATPTINDDCGATLTVITNTISTNILGDVDTEYVYLATDCGGRSDICRVIYAYDLPIDPPTIDCPPGATELGCNPIIPSADAVLATATGECSIATADARDSITMDGCIATLTRVHTVVDTCGLATICTQVFTWSEDVEAPTFTCEPPLDLGCNPTTFPDAAVVLATAADNCGIVTSWFESVVGQADCQITETRTFYAVDGCGNTGSCIRVLQWIEDRTPPVLEGCPAETLIVVLPGELPQPPTISANDNCGTPSLRTEINPLSTNEFGVDVEYVYTAEDCAGAQTVCRVTFTYNYASLPAPTIDCNPDPVILTCGADFRGRPSSAAVVATAASACGIISNHVETTQMDTPCGSTLLRTYTVFDACGRSSVCTDSYTSNRQDFNPPILTVPVDTSICSGGNIAPAFTGIATATDDCGITEITFVDTPLSNDCGTGIQRSWTAIDLCGNSASLNQLILVAENTLPAFDCSSDGFLEPAPPPATGFLVPDLTSQLLGDQACPVFVTQTPAADTIVTAATVVNVVVSNACGQSDRCQVTLSIPAGPQAIIGNEVWEDLNANGLRETSEPALPGVTVLLLNANGSTAATTLTDAQGLYQFIIDFGSSPPIARGANPSVSYLVAFNAPQFAATRGGKSVILVGGNQSAPFDVASGDVIQDKDIGLVQPGSITGVVWQDLDNDNIPDDNLSELGVNGVTVELRRIENGAPVAVGSTRTATNTQGEQGSYTFDNLLPGEYEIYVDMATLPRGSTLTPADGALRVTLASGAAITPNDLQANFNFTPGPTAAVLLSFASEFGIATWHIGTEDQTLGYQLVDLATGLVVGDGFILATGGGEYRQAGLEPGQYALVEVDSDLARNTLGELTVYPEADADPTGEPTRLLEAGADGRLAFITESGINSYFVTGVASQAIVLDVSRPDSPVRLRVKTIVNELGTALYFSWPAGASLQIR